MVILVSLYFYSYFVGFSFLRVGDTGVIVHMYCQKMKLQIMFIYMYCQLQKNETSHNVHMY